MRTCEDIVMDLLQGLREFFENNGRGEAWPIIEQALQPWAEAKNPMPLVQSVELDYAGYLVAFTAATGLAINDIEMVSRAAYKASPEIREELKRRGVPSSLSGSPTRSVIEDALDDVSGEIGALTSSFMDDKLYLHGTEDTNDDLQEILSLLIYSVFVDHKSVPAWQQLVALQQQAIAFGLDNKTLLVFVA